MKKIIKQLNIFVVAAILLVPVLVSADTQIYGGYDYDYGGYDYTYDYGGYDYDYGYGGYDYDYGGYDYDYGYGGYDYTYDYGGYDYDYNYGGYDYDYNYGGYDYDYGYGGYDYTYDYGGYDYDYNYGGYDYDYNYGGYDYDYGYGGYDYDYQNVGYGTNYQTPYYDNNYDDYYYDYNYPSYTYDYVNVGGNYGCGYSYSCDDTIVVIDDRDYDIDVVCRVSNTRIDEGDSVTFTADVDGGRGSISYNWSGDISSSSSVVTRRFNNEGDYEVRVTVRDSRGNTATDDCPTVVVEGDNENYDLDVVCRVSDTRIEKGERVTFEADVSGGRGRIDYDWSGDINSSSRDVRVEFSDEGEYEARITVEDAYGNIASDECPTVVVDDEEEDDDFDIVCRISDTRIEEGDKIRVEVDIEGGSSPFDIRWYGDTDEVDDFDEDARSQRIEIDDRGTYVFEVEVEDDEGKIRRDECPVVRVNDDDDDDDDNGVFVSSNSSYRPTGTYSGVSSVYLNQVPYTGPADTFKLIGFIGLVLLWSFAGAFMIRKKMKNHEQSKRILAFKEANKNS